MKYRLKRQKRPRPHLSVKIRDIDIIDTPTKRSYLEVRDEFWNFNFLNLSHTFNKHNVNWSFDNFGLLWSYNLNYFDWLNQSGLTKEQGLSTLKSFYAAANENNPIIFHPYPTSLRIINTAKFIAKWNIKDDWLYNELASDLKFLKGRLEYHLLANHLLENAFALYIGGLITNQDEFILKGKKLLLRELKEQVLQDGMHYERSPMYHLLIMERLLDALNFAKATNNDLEFTLKAYSVKMASFSMNWDDLNRIPMMQDSAYGIALEVSTILGYAKRLLGEDYPLKRGDLRDSGYRRLSSADFILFANVGSIGPSYQPGHAHADELNFELFHRGVPIIVDTGVSTYEKNERRLVERSTRSHNCIVLGSNSSDVWSGFRVGKRANVKISLDDDQKLIATHDGFDPLILRSFDSSIIGQITIKDKLENRSTSKSSYGKGYLHFHPDVYLEQLNGTTFLINNQIVLTINSDKYNSPVINIEQYSYAKGYNMLIESTVISYSVFKQTKIQLREVN